MDISSSSTGGMAIDDEDNMQSMTGINEIAALNESVNSEK